MQNQTSKAEDTDKTDSPCSAKWWCEQLDLADKEAKDPLRQGADAYKEYTYAACNTPDFAFDKASNQHIALFWANIQTLMPAIYSQTPSTIARRVFSDKDDVGRVAASGLERAARTLLKRSRFDKVMDRINQDFLIPGRGIGRVFYDGATEVTPESVTPEWVSYESVRTTPGARDWSQIWWVSFDHFLDKRKFSKRFGAKLKDWENKIPFAHTSTRTKDEDDSSARNENPQTGGYCRITEIWNKRDRRICWVSRDHRDEYLDESEDIYELVSFFPCPEPAQLTIGNQTYYPISDFVQYRQALMNIDMLANRIFRLLRAMRARGVYDSTQTEIGRLAKEANEADLVPVDNYIEFVEKGGLEALIQYAPVEVLANALVQCYQALESQKQLVYEITGISDIIRGQSNASETATAQQIKSNYADIRLRKRVKEIARVARDLIELMLDLAIRRFSYESFTELAGVAFMDEADQQLWQQAYELIVNDKFRTLRIDIETDSTLALKGDAETQSRIELLNALSQYYTQAIQVSIDAPELLTAMSDTAMHVIRDMRQSAAVESSIEEGFERLKERVSQPPPEPPPDPAIELEKMRGDVKMQVEAHKAEMKAQTDQQKMMADVQSEQMKIGVLQEVERVKAEAAAQVAALKLESDKALEMLRQQGEAKMEHLRMVTEMAVEKERSKNDLEVEKLRGQIQVLIAKMGDNTQRELAEERSEGGEEKEADES